MLAAVLRMWLPVRLCEECCCQFAMRSIPPVSTAALGVRPILSPVAVRVTCGEAWRFAAARLAQPAERKALSLPVVGLSLAMGVVGFCVLRWGYWCPKRAPREGLALPALRLTAPRSNQLSCGGTRLGAWLYVMLGRGERAPVRFFDLDI